MAVRENCGRMLILNRVTHMFSINKVKSWSQKPNTVNAKNVILVRGFRIWVGKDRGK